MTRKQPLSDNAGGFTIDPPNFFIFKEDSSMFFTVNATWEQPYLFEENFRLNCDFFGSKVKINFPEYMLPLPRKI